MTSQTLQDLKTFGKNNLLRNFTAAHRNQLPVLTRLLDWEGPPTVLENHKVIPGTELVLHGWTRQSKVLATTDLSSTVESPGTVSLIHNSITRHYAIPLTYQGDFQLRTTGPRGSSVVKNRAEVLYRAVDLVNLPHGASVIVSNVPSNDVRSSGGLNVGDVLYINSVRGHHPNAFISCEKLEVDGQLTAVNIASNSSITFMKYDPSAKNAGANHTITVANGAAVASGINIDGKALTIRDLVPYLNAARDTPLEVELVRYGGDHTVDGIDLPLRQVIVLKGLIVEPAVYTSVKTPVAPSFHVPMRANIYVRYD